MPQHTMKKKVTVPKGVQQKVKKQKPQGAPQRGKMLFIKPKKQVAVMEHKMTREVTKIINGKNEEMANQRANTAQGKKSSKKKS